MKKFLLLACVPLILMGCQGNGPADPDKDPIEIGGVLPLSGDVAVYGMLLQNAANLRVEEVNQAGGIDGRPVKILWEDGKCTPGDAAKAAQKLVNVDKVSVILGGGCSGETLGIAPFTERKKIILLTPLSTSPLVSEAGDFVFRTTPSDASQAQRLGDYANEKAYTKIGILAEQTDYAMSLANAFEKQFEGETVRENFLTEDSDFKTRITKIKNEEVDAIFLSPQSPAKMALLLKQLQEQNIEKPLLLNEFGLSQEEGILNYFDYLATLPEVMASSFVAPENQKFKDFVLLYEERYGAIPSYDNYVATSVDGIDLLIDALKAVEDKTDTEAIRDYLYSIENYPGMYPNLSIDENGDANISHALFRFDPERKAMILLNQ